MTNIADMRGTHRLVLTALAALGIVAVSCGSDNAKTAPTTTEAATTPTQAKPDVSGGITVFAASSLTASYTEIANAFMTEFPKAKVTLNFGASSDLVTQINEGAPADVYASADAANMKKLTDAAGNAGDPQTFATNSLEIIVGKGNPKGITGVADLAKPGVIFVTCAPEVPIGKYSAQVLSTAGVTVTPASLEQNVKGIVTKVTLGEADAGIVYKTDVMAAGDKAAGVEIPADINVTATYPLVATKASTNSAGAQAFVDFVLGEQGRKIMASYGFTAP